MNIREEYKRLCQIAQSPEGWKRIEEAWLFITNHEKRDGEWYSRGDTKGTQVFGFAIDLITKKIAVCDVNNHLEAFQRLVDGLTEEGFSDDEAISRVVRGWSGEILDFGYPCVLLASHLFFEYPVLLDEVEEAILNQEQGLPITKLYISNV